MSNPEYFRNRAAEYRQQALGSPEERRAGDLFEIARLFNSMADNLTFLMKPTPPLPQSRVLAILAWARPISLGQFARQSNLGLAKEFTVSS